MKHYIHNVRQGEMRNSDYASGILISNIPVLISLCGWIHPLSQHIYVQTRLGAIFSSITHTCKFESRNFTPKLPFQTIRQPTAK